MDVEINFKGTIMKTLEHEIRDVMSRKKEQDLIEEVNNNFINMINDMYEEEISEEKFIQLYELYIIHLNEQNEFKIDKNYPHAQLVARSNNPVNPKPFSTPSPTVDARHAQISPNGNVNLKTSMFGRPVGQLSTPPKTFSTFYSDNPARLVYGSDGNPLTSSNKGINQPPATTSGGNVPATQGTRQVGPAATPSNSGGSSSTGSNTQSPIDTAKARLTATDVKAVNSGVSNITKYGSRALGVLGAGYDAYNRYKEGQSAGHIVAGTGATVAGGLYGAAKGAALGATIGSAVPIVGTAAGGVVGGLLGGAIGGYTAGKAVDLVADAASPNPNAKPPNSATTPAATPPPVSPPGSKEKSPIAVDPLSGTVTDISKDKKQEPLDKNQINYTNRGFSLSSGTSPENKIKQATQSTGNITGSNIHMTQPTTPTPASTNVSRQPEMTTPLAGGATDSKMNISTPPKINTGSVPQPATTSQTQPTVKTQEPPESARKQKPSTSSDSSYSGRSIGDYGKDNSWVQPAFNRG